MVPYNTYDHLPDADNVKIHSLMSSDFKEGGELQDPQLSKAFGVPNGADHNPQLSWSAFGDDTKCYTITCYDPDAPTVSGFWHWVVANVPATIHELPTNADISAVCGEKAVTLKNDAGFAGFCGAAPPPGHGKHRYIFCVTGLSEDLPVDATTSPAVCHFQMLGKVTGRAFLTGLYGR